MLIYGYTLDDVVQYFDIYCNNELSHVKRNLIIYNP